ncbi:MAG: nitroreductase family protein [Clostridiales Family XIII bacterium]|jgi:nitroreductase|nr:nitroreductase family protein [Clostridiales Family XIII bacterium]
METLKAIETRKSTRGFLPEQISDAALDTILKAGVEAPVGMGAFDSIHFAVIQDAALLRKISDAATKNTEREGQDIYYGAPTVVVISSTEQPMPELAFANAGTIVENFLLAATDIGIGNVYIFGSVMGFKNDPSLSVEAGIPEGYTPVSSVALGYATEEANAIPKVERNIPVSRK